MKSLSSTPAVWFRLQMSALGLHSNFLAPTKESAQHSKAGGKKAFMAGRGVSAT
jgi:hypothetical protein